MDRKVDKNMSRNSITLNGEERQQLKADLLRFVQTVCADGYRMPDSAFAALAPVVRILLGSDQKA